MARSYKKLKIHKGEKSYESNVSNENDEGEGCLCK